MVAVVMVAAMVVVMEVDFLDMEVMTGVMVEVMTGVMVEIITEVTEVMEDTEDMDKLRYAMVSSSCFSFNCIKGPLFSSANLPVKITRRLSYKIQQTRDGNRSG